MVYVVKHNYIGLSSHDYPDQVLIPLMGFECGHGLNFECTHRYLEYMVPKDHLYLVEQICQYWNKKYGTLPMSCNLTTAYDPCRVVFYWPKTIQHMTEQKRKPRQLTPPEIMDQIKGMNLEAQFDLFLSFKQHIKQLNDDAIREGNKRNAEIMGGSEQ